MNRNQILQLARARSNPTSAATVTYTQAELAEREAMRDLALLVRKWRLRALAEPAPFPLVRLKVTAQGLTATVVRRKQP